MTIFSLNVAINKSKINLFFVILFFFAVSCSQSVPDVKREPVPEWFISVSAGDPRFFYGSANHSNKSKAVELALKDIASVISVNIKGSSTTQSFKSGLTTGSKYSESVESEVKKIEFSNYEIENQALVNNKYYVRVRVSKQSVIQTTQEKYADADRANKSSVALAATMDKLGKMFQFKKSEKSLTEAYNKLILLRSLKQFDPLEGMTEKEIQANLLRYESYFQEYQTILNSIIFVIQSDSELSPISKAIGTALSEEGIKNVINENNNSDGIILAQGTVEKGEIQGYKSMTYLVSISIKDNKGKNLGSIPPKKIIGFSVQSHDGAANDATNKFIALIKKEGGFLKMMNL